MLALVLCLTAGQPAPPTPAPVPPPPAIKLPAALTVGSGKLGKLTPETSAKTVKWVSLTPGLSIEPVDGGRTLYLTGPAGTYELLAYVAVAGEPSDPVRVKVTIEPPPAPPAPPVPPAPPAPPDPLKVKLAAAYLAAAGTPEQKKEWGKDLAALYRAAAKFSADPAVATSSALKAKLSAAAAVLVGDTALKELRLAVAGELAAVVPADADLTADQRTAVAALFTRLAAYLESIAN